MEVIDTITADQIEINDVISLDGEEIQVKEIDDSDEYAVTVKGYSYSTGDSVACELPYDYTVDILGS